MNLEPLEVFALTSDMQRATGSIPYTSLMWDRRYYEVGQFLMEIPGDVYDSTWAYIYTDERPETGIIESVEYKHVPHSSGTVILRGRFLEAELNRYTFLVEETEDEAYRIYKPAPAKTVKPTLWTDNLGQTYVKTGGTGGVLAKWETIDGDYVDPETIDQSSLTQVELGAGEGMRLREYDTTNLDKFPSGKWTANEYTNDNYSYYSTDGRTLHSVAPNGTEKTFPILRGGTGDVIYEGEDGQLKWVNGVASSLGSTYVRARDSWEHMVKTEGLEVVTGDGTIMGGSTYARAYREVKGPWQLRTDLDVNEPADNVQRIIQWAQDIWGNNLLYDEVGFTGEEKIIDPSLKLFGDLAYEELKTVGASPRLSYSFESDTCVFEVWRGLDRTQSQAGVPAPPEPDEPEPDEPTIDELYEAVDYIQSDGTQYIDTGVYPNQDTRLVMDVTLPSESEIVWLAGGRTSSGSAAFCIAIYPPSSFRSDYAGGYVTLNAGEVEGRKLIDKNGSTFEVNDYATTNTSATFVSSSTLVLFANNTGGTISSNNASGRLHSCQIYQDGSTLDRKLMPYRRKADGIFGLLDLVNEVFYESASGVPFTGPSYPAGTYEELDYIVSTGAQYIDTGVLPTQKTKVVCDAEYTTVNGTAPTLFGVWESSSSQYAVVVQNAVISLWFGSGGSTLSSASYAGRKIWSIGGGIFSAGDKSAATPSGSFTSAHSVYVCALNLNGTATYHSSTRQYGMQIYGDGTTLDRDFAPRRRASDGAVGLLDLANDTFYESAGSEPFLAPGELPAGYTRLGYIESTGSQYIDTGISPDINTGVEMGVYRTGLTSKDQSPCMTIESGGVAYWGFSLGTNVVIWCWGSYAQISGLSFESDRLYKFSLNYMNDKAVKIDGAQYATLSTSAEITSNSIYLFDMNKGSFSTNQPFVGRIPYAKFTRDGDLIGDFIPVKNASGEAGMFDMVSMKFYADAAGVGFVAGPELAAVAEVAEVSAFALTRTVAASDESNTAANPFAVFSDTWGTLYGFTASRDVSNYRNTCYVLYQFRDQVDADGNPIGPRGYVKARLDDELPDAETYLDLRGEEPEDDQTDEAFIESLRQRGLAHLQTNYAAIESLDTGTLAGNGYLDGYDLGDKVDMLVEAIGLIKEARITGVCEVHEVGSSTATLEIGEQKITNIRKAVIV